MTHAMSSPAALRNRDPILAILRQELPAGGLVLELASGSGEHVTHFAAALPAIDWQPSDPSAEARASVAARIAETGLANIRPPLDIDAAHPASWPITRADALLAINMAHISPWAATIGLFQGAGRLLAAGAPLILYGPWIEDDIETATTNLAFDADLKTRNPAWGLRHRAQADQLALASGLRPVARHPMPANNILLVFRRAAQRESSATSASAAASTSAHVASKPSSSP